MNYKHLKDVTLAFILLISVSTGLSFFTLNCKADDTKNNVQIAIEQTAAYEQQMVPSPTCSSVGGEWTVLGLSRCNKLPDSMKNNYLVNLKNTLADCNGVLSSKKYTEYARVVLSLSSINVDATQFYGYLLLTNLADYDKVTWQGVNGAAYALLALDSRQYDVPIVVEGTQVSRQNLIDFLLEARLEDGGWSVSGSSSDPDVTAMVITAIAPYRNDNSKVAEAVAKGLEVLSKLQLDDGGFSSSGMENSESISQVLVALSTLGIPVEDARFVKNGNSIVNVLLTYQNEDGSFCHVHSDGGNGMSTEQALYALTSYSRFINGQTTLYNMTDIMNHKNDLSPTMTAEEFIMRCQDISDTPVIDDLSEIDLLLQEAEEQGEFEQKNTLVQRLLLCKQYIENTKQFIDELDQNIWNKVDPLRISQDDTSNVQTLYSKYLLLKEEDRLYVKYAKDLEDAKKVIDGFQDRKILKKVFENLQQTKESFHFNSEISNKTAYSILINSEDIISAGDMDARIRMKNESGVSAPENCVIFTLPHKGKLPAKCKITLNGMTDDGDYELHYLTKQKDSLLPQIKVKNKSFSFQTQTGGTYYLLKQKVSGEKENEGVANSLTTQPESTVNVNNKTNQNGIKKKDSSNTETNKKMTDKSQQDKQQKSENQSAKPTGIFTKEQLMSIQGYNRNLYFEMNADENNPYAYRCVINGLDIEEVNDIDARIKFSGRYDKDMNDIAKSPFYIYMNQNNNATIMYVEIKSNLTDGDYILCSFEPDDMTASYIKKISITDRTIKMTVKQGGIYFLSDQISKEVKIPDMVIKNIQRKKNNSKTEHIDKHMLVKLCLEDLKEYPVFIIYTILFVLSVVICISLLIKRKN